MTNILDWIDEELAWLESTLHGLEGNQVTAIRAKIQEHQKEVASEPQEVYTVASNIHQTYGHGDSGSTLMICKGGWYHSGDFPPLFETEEEAEDYRKNLVGQTQVVKLKIINTHEKETKPHR